jgi:hypothetical protein
MAALFSTGLIADIMLAFMALEAIVLVLYQRKTNRGFTPRAVFWMLLPGACLVLALRAALVGAPWPWLALAVSVSLIAHLGYLRERLRQR